MSAKIGFGFPRGLGLNPCPVFRGSQFLSLKPVMAGGLYKRWSIQNYNSVLHETWKSFTDFVYV